MRVLTALLLAGAISQSGPAPRSIPEIHQDHVAASLQLAGGNGVELEEALLRMGDELWDSGCFLLAYLPYRDLGTITADLILENLQCAHACRDSLWWGSSIPERIFRHYVLPHRVSQERLTRWRKALFAELYPIVRDSGSMTEAALRINEWLGSKVRFEPTEARDQSPLTTLARGVGRCEELTILYICAARAVCVPARSCWTPWWAVSDNNHAWVEVWVDGGWHYLGAAEPAESLDVAWFSDPARRAAAVYSACFGRCEGGNEHIYRTTDRYAIVNSIGTYSRPCSLLVSVTDDAGTPVARVQVHAHVYNFGQLLPVGRARTDGDGWAMLVLGPGDYLLTGGDGDRSAWSVVSAQPDAPSALRLRLAHDTPPPEGFIWLRYPEPPP